MDFSFHDLNIQNDLSGKIEIFIQCDTSSEVNSVFKEVFFLPLYSVDCVHIIGSAAEFLCSKAANSRVILASCKDALLQAVGTLTCHEAGIRALESCSLANQKTLIGSLLRPYQVFFFI